MKDKHDQERTPAIVVGLATLPYCSKSRCWMLPAGPRQIRREVKSFDDAMGFAKELNNLISQRV